MQSTENFAEYSVVQLKEYLKQKGITTSNPSKEQLLILCSAAKTLQSDPNLEECNTSKIIEGKLIKIGLTRDPTSLNYTSRMQLTAIPPFGLIDIFNYLIYSRTDYDKRKLKAFKSFDDYKLYQDGHVRKLEMCKQNDYCFFRASVLPTCRKTTFLKTSAYVCWFALNPEGEVYVAHCQCMGGSDGGCRHIAASLYELNQFVSDATSITDGPCTWSNKSRPSDEPMPAKDLYLLYQANSCVEESSFRHFCSTEIPSNEDINQFFNELSQIDDASTSLELHSGPPKPQAEQFEKVDCSSLSPLQRIITYFQANPGNYLDPYCLNNQQLFEPSELELIENFTKGQSENSNWFEIRRGMMTASNFHRIRTRSKSLKVDPSLCPGALLRQLFRGRPAYPTLPAGLLWGQKCEKKALKLYKKFLPKLHLRPQVATSGFCVFNENYLVGGSPDGVCSCKCRKASSCPRRWLVEVKCPYTMKYRPAKVAAMQNGCSYDLIKREWVLSPSHKHYTQIQGLMGVLQYSLADLAIYTTKGLVVVPVEFDEDFFLRLKHDLMFFQEKYLFPYIVKMYL